MTDQPAQARANRIRMLGDFEVVLNGVRIERWRAGRSRTLFQYLLANLGTPVSRAALIDAVWGESTARRPEISLKVAVCALRSMLSEVHSHGVTAPHSPPSVWLVSRASGYSLEVSDAHIDVREFEKALDQASARKYQGREDEALDLLRHAVAVNGGPYLPDCAAPWAAMYRERLQDGLLNALAALAEAALRRGDRMEELELHQRMLTVDPCREESYRALMRWHAQAGQLSRVQDWYLTCVEQLRGRLGVDAAAQTRRAFYEAIGGHIVPPPAVGAWRA